jgi:hypothetical protein
VNDVIYLQGCVTTTSKRNYSFVFGIECSFVLNKRKRNWKNAIQKIEFIHLHEQDNDIPKISIFYTGEIRKSIKNINKE